MDADETHQAESRAASSGRAQKALQAEAETPSALNESLNEIVLEGLRQLTTGLAVLCAVFVIFDWLEVHDQATIPIIYGDLALAVTFLVLRALLDHGSMLARFSSPIGALVALLVHAAVLLELTLRSDPVQTGYVLMIATAAGFFVLSFPWLVATLATLYIAWALVIWPVVSPAVFIDLSIALLSASAVSLIVRAARVRSLLRLHDAISATQVEASERGEAERALRERRQSEAIQAVLLQISQAVSTAETLNELMTIVHKQLAELVDTTNFFLALFDDATGTYSFPYHVDEFDEVPTFESQRLEKSLTDYVRRTGNALLADEEVDKRLTEGGEVEMVGTPSQIWLGVPLKTTRGVIGVLGLQSYTEASIYSEQDLGLMMVVSENIALAIERKRTEEALRESETKYRLLFENMLNGYALHEIILDERGTPIDYVFLEANSAFEQLTGLKRENIIGKKVTEILPSIKEDSIDWIGRYGAVVLTGQEIRFDNYAQSLDKWYSVLAFSVRNGQFATIFEDVTERKKAEQEREHVLALLRQSEQLYRELFEMDQAALYITTKDGQFVDANTAFLDLFGYSHEDLRVFTVLDSYADPADRLEFQRVIERDGAVKEYPAKLRKKDGTEMDCLISATARRDQGGESVRYQGVVQDVSEKRHLEEQLRQSQKMDAVGQLAGGVAHDFNNLLTGITGYSQLTLGTLDEGDSRAQDIRKVLQMSRRAADLTRQLLAFSRRQPLEPRVLNLNALVEDSSKMFKRLIGENIEVELVAATDLDNVRADPGQVEQVLMNLVVNARGAMPEGGKLIIETANIELDESYCAKRPGAIPGHFVMLAVSDTGCGMDKETRRQIFEPFFTTKQKGEGTGLGLATVYGIVKQHGGNIGVYSEPGRGTSFKVYLPRVNEDVEDITASGKFSLKWEGSGTILLVEDEDGVREVARRMLEMQGYQVIAAETPKEAERLFSEQSARIDLLLTDIVMPEMDGPALHERLSQNGRSLPVLYMSGYTEAAASYSRVLESGAPFLQKPFTPTQLGEKVMEVLNA